MTSLTRVVTCLPPVTSMCAATHRQPRYLKFGGFWKHFSADSVLFSMTTSFRHWSLPFWLPPELLYRQPFFHYSTPVPTAISSTTLPPTCVRHPDRQPPFKMHQWYFGSRSAPRPPTNIQDWCVDLFLWRPPFADEDRLPMFHVSLLQLWRLHFSTCTTFYYRFMVLAFGIARTGLSMIVKLIIGAVIWDDENCTIAFDPGTVFIGKIIASYKNAQWQGAHEILLIRNPNLASTRCSQFDAFRNSCMQNSLSNFTYVQLLTCESLSACNYNLSHKFGITIGTRSSFLG